MTKKTNGGPAFPARVSVNREGDVIPHQFGNGDFCTPGMTLRDHFAAKAMQARITALCATEMWSAWSSEAIAKDAYEFADSMLAARADGGQP